MSKIEDFLAAFMNTFQDEFSSSLSMVVTSLKNDFTKALEILGIKSPNLFGAANELLLTEYSNNVNPPDLLREDILEYDPTWCLNFCPYNVRRRVPRIDVSDQFQNSVIAFLRKIVSLFRSKAPQTHSINDITRRVEDAETISCTRRPTSSTASGTI
jgi:hypothetical protein